MEFFFFPKSCLNVGGAAYTRVRLIHESLRYFLARSGEIRFEVIGHKQCGGLEVQCQLEFNGSNESTNETLERASGEQDLG